MSRFLVHLRKEWRTHRFALGFVLVGFPLALTLLAAVSEVTYARDWFLAPLVGAAAAAAMLVGVGGELLGSERGARGFSWLERLPHGLGAAFAAKLVVLLLSTVAALAAGSGAWAALCWMRPLETTRMPLAGQLSWLLLVLPVAAWTFALSTWALRGGLAFVAALLGIAILIGPGASLWFHGYRGVPEWLGTGWTLFTLAGFLAAYLGFVPRGMRGAGRGRALGWTSLPALLFLLPAWGWAAERTAQRERLVPGKWDVGLAVATRDGRTVFAQVRPDGTAWEWEVLPEQVVRIELETGEWTTVGGQGALLKEIRSEGSFSALALVVSTGRQRIVFDAADGTPREWGPDLEVEPWEPAGLGWSTGRWNDERIHDPLRGRTYGMEELRPPLDARVHHFVVLPGRWLVSTDRGLLWLDPDSKQVDETDWAGYSLRAVRSDGTLAWTRMDRQEGTASVVLLDPVSGRTEALFPGSTRDRPHFIHSRKWGGPGEPSERPLVRISGTMEALGVPHRRVALDPPFDSRLWSLVAWPTEELALLVDPHGGEFLEVDFASGCCRSVFPRAMP